jgi:hypothetical protein
VGNNKIHRLFITISHKSNSNIEILISISQNQDPVLNECAARLGVSLRQTEDQLTRDMLAGTAAFINCVGGVNGDNPTELTRSDVDDVIRALLGNNAYTILDNIEGDDKFGTAPKMNGRFKFSLIDLETVVYC